MSKWAIIEPVRGQYDWTEPDRLIDFLHDHGIEPMLMLYCAPKWAMRGTPADEALFIARGQQNLHTVVWPRRDCLRDFERFKKSFATEYLMVPTKYWSLFDRSIHRNVLIVFEKDPLDREVKK